MSEMSTNIELAEVKIEKSSSKIDPNRDKWASKTEFFLSSMGYAIGIGNVWRFPYLCYRNGGGAFLVPYLLMLFFCGIPLFFLETCLGQFASVGCISIFKMAPLLKGTGFAIVVVNVICTMYYNVIISYPILFFIRSMRFTLPWESCDNSWNTENCYMHTLDLTGQQSDTANTTIPRSVGRLKTPADEFFNNEILQISDGIEHPNGIVWPLFFCNLLSWIVVYLCIRNGVKSVGKVVYFTATFPFVILGILLIRGLTLPGAIDGIKFYIMPEWDQLFRIRVWADAAVQIFFSLGPGWGGIVNMASYNQFHNDNVNDAILIPILNCGTSIVAGFVVFSVLGFLSAKTGLPVSSVATGGPGLAFVTYPEAISMLPLPQLWAALFFMMLYLLGMDSCFVQIEAIITSIVDEYPKIRSKKPIVTVVFVFMMFLGSISCVTRGGMYLLQLLDWYCATFSVILICLVEICMVTYSYGLDNFITDIEFMLEKRMHMWWRLCWKIVTPMILVFIFFTTLIFNTEITYNDKAYPRWAIAFGWIVSLSSMLCIPFYAAVKLLRANGTILERLRDSMRTKNWGPAQRGDFDRWTAFKKNHS